MNDDNISTEHRILITMRQVLSSIVRDTTPPPGLRHPLTDSTIDDIKQCFALITAREKELNEAQGRPASRPRYIDEPRKSQVVKLVRPEKKDD
ncbi:MAG: segregation and condensation protein A [Gammaproteobacteria bacterium]